MKPPTTHEEFCLKNAAHFVAVRGRTPRDRTRQQFATSPEAQAFPVITTCPPRFRPV